MNYMKNDLMSQGETGGQGETAIQIVILWDTVTGPLPHH